jgi:hypothetical protein
MGPDDLGYGTSMRFSLLAEPFHCLGRQTHRQRPLRQSLGYGATGHARIV